MHVRFAVTMDSRGYSDVAETCKFIDQAGFAMLWFSDTQSLHRELYVNTTVAAMHTKQIRLNPGPTNPLTRHPAVTASAISSIDELSGGRAAITMSTGDSAVYNLGLKAAKLDTLKEYILAMKALWRDHEAIYQGKTIRLVWAKRPIPVYITAEGPKSLRLAGQIADGVVVGLGLTPEAIKGALEYIRQGAAESGRRLEDLDIWWQTRWNIADDRETAVDEIRGSLAAAANHTFRFTFQGKFLPEHMEEPVRRLQQAYVFAQHGSSEAAHAPLVQELGLRDYLARRFAIAGTLSDFIGRVEELASLGVTQLRLAAGGRDRNRIVHAVAKEVMPHFR